jgi:hypothetical protein
VARQFTPYRHRRPRRSPSGGESRGAFLRTLLLVWAAVAVGTWAAMPQLMAVSNTVTTTPEQREAVERSAYYRNCDAARAAGAAPMYRGQAGYREGLDGDPDGIACDPYRY